MREEEALFRDILKGESKGKTTKPTLQVVNKRPGFTKPAATEEVTKFIGWNYIEGLINQVPKVLKDRYGEEILLSESSSPDKWVHEITENDILMHKAVVAFLFQSGARASEVFGRRIGGRFVVNPATINMINLDDDPKVVIVEKFPVLKHYQKIDFEILKEASPVVSPSRAHLWHYDKDSGLYQRKEMTTERVNTTRTFYFPRDEPITKYFLDWLNKRPEDSPELFKWGYRYWYNFLKMLDIMTKDYGKLKWKTIYPHWFRAQRASQLASDYGFDLHELMEWFGWLDITMGLKYSALGEKLATRMTLAKTDWRARRKVVEPKKERKTPEELFGLV